MEVCGELLNRGWGDRKPASCKGWVTGKEDTMNSGTAGTTGEVQWWQGPGAIHSVHLRICALEFEANLAYRAREKKRRRKRGGGGE